jgi:uncharacterized protein
MTFTEQIDQDLKAAMLAKDEVKKLTLRAIKKEIIEAKTAPGANGEVSDETVMKIVAKMLKQRKESAAIYQQQGRPELAESELAEATVLEAYLPQPLTLEALQAELKSIFQEIGAKGPQDMGKVMGIASKKLAGKVDGRMLSETVKTLLQSL